MEVVRCGKADALRFPPSPLLILGRETAQWLGIFLFVFCLNFPCFFTCFVISR
jgi:hypothetical protein